MKFISCVLSLLSVSLLAGPADAHITHRRVQETEVPNDGSGGTIEAGGTASTSVSVRTLSVVLQMPCIFYLHETYFSCHMTSF